MKEEERMEFWKLGTSVTDDSKQLLAWVNAMPSWKAAEEEEAAAAAEKAAAEKAAAEAARKAEGKPFERPALRRQSSTNDKTLLIKYKEELEELEAKKAAAGDDDEVVRKRLLQQVTEKHALLDESVQKRIAILTAAAASFERLIKECDVDPIALQVDTKQHYVGPHSGRDAALAMGWLEVSGDAALKTREEASAEMKRTIHRHSVSVQNELSFLKQMALAAKVVAHVTSPMHKKLLNLCHNWLR
jgi:hypothetical protein